MLASLNDLINGAIHNPDTYRAYCRIEAVTGYSFRKDFWLSDLQPSLLPQETLSAVRHHKIKPQFLHRFTPYNKKKEIIMADQIPSLDWQPVLLIKVHQQILSPHYIGLSVARIHFAEHPDGIVACGWDVPVAQREYPRVQRIGWIPARDVPFALPVQFHHRLVTMHFTAPRQWQMVSTAGGDGLRITCWWQPNISLKRQSIY